MALTGTQACYRPLFKLCMSSYSPDRNRMTARISSAALASIFLAGAALIAEPQAASASVQTFPDANDVAGRLDIRSVGHGHVGSTKLAHTLTTYKRWPSSLLFGGRRLVFQLDTNGSWQDGVERTLVISWRDGALRALLRNRAGRVVGTASVVRPDRRTVRVTFGKKALGNAAGYRWRARAVNAGVTDLAPKVPELHDYTKPGIQMVDFPDPSTNVSTTASFDVAFQLGDRGFSGLADWQLERREVGSDSWSTLAEGTESGQQTVAVDGVEGASYVFRVSARDNEGNVARTSRTISVPIDDTHPSITYSSPEGTDWTFSITEGFALFFMDTLETNGFVGASFSYSFVGSHFAWVAPGTGGSAAVVFDGGTPRNVVLPSSGQRHVVLTVTLPPGSHTVVVTSTSGTIGVDGLAVR
jgi:hypothetical protein